ncbi:MAG: AAA family ATPase [Alphaproteobacteria bacterium]|nr:AAA family ATPase [Alphaproteobacteria bacterium]
MIRGVEVRNYKSILEAKVDLGRVNVLIGENGAGKSNFLEALALASAASQDRLAHEFLAPRGVRWVEAGAMVSAFAGSEAEIEVWVHEGGGRSSRFSISRNPSSPIGLMVRSSQRGGAPLHPWESGLLTTLQEKVQSLRQAEQGSEELRELEAKYSAVLSTIVGRMDILSVRTFLIFSPEYSLLRVFQDETQILPLGVRGEGLFAHLKKLSQLDDGAVLREISDQLDLIDWFDGFEVPNDLAPGERSLRLRDRYLIEQRVFDQRSANEGFLFLLFYFTLLISPQTPSFFAVDNVDASLNPKLCTALIRRMVHLAKKHDKQMILTTHNPAVLDGLDLSDDEQRLFVVSRDSQGRTRLRRAKAPRPIGDDSPVRLSEAFMNGFLGGLPSNF